MTTREQEREMDAKPAPDRSRERRHVPGVSPVTRSNAGTTAKRLAELFRTQILSNQAGSEG